MQSLFSNRFSLDTFELTVLHEALLRVFDGIFGDLLFSSPRAATDKVDAGQEMRCLR